MFCLALLSNFIIFLSSSLAWVYDGVTLWCLNSSSKAKPVNSFEVNAGPLSVSTCSDVPCVAKTFFSLFFVDFADVEYTISMSGNLVLLSMTT